MSEEDEILAALTRLMTKRRGRTINEYERDNSRERIRSHRPWERARIGNVESQIATRCHTTERQYQPAISRDSFMSRLSGTKMRRLSS